MLVILTFIDYGFMKNEYFQVWPFFAKIEAFEPRFHKGKDTNE